MPYLDTSLLVAALTNEARTDTVQKWLASQPLDELIISDWVATEFSAALSMKLRRDELSVELRADVLAEFTHLARDSFTMWLVEHDDFQMAAKLADQHTTGIRAGDALHVALVANRGEQLISLDKGLVEAALALGVSASLL